MDEVMFLYTAKDTDRYLLTLESMLKVDALPDIKRLIDSCCNTWQSNSILVKYYDIYLNKALNSHNAASRQRNMIYLLMLILNNPTDNPFINNKAHKELNKLAIERLLAWGMIEEGNFVVILLSYRSIAEVGKIKMDGVIHETFLDGIYATVDILEL